MFDSFSNICVLNESYLFPNWSFQYTPCGSLNEKAVDIFFRQKATTWYHLKPPVVNTQLPWKPTENNLKQCVTYRVTCNGTAGVKQILKYHPTEPVTIESLGETVKGGLQQIASKLSGENKSAMTFNQADTGYKPLHGYDPTSNHSLQSPVRQSEYPCRNVS